jgi:hypothetical protein
MYILQHNTATLYWIIVSVLRYEFPLHIITTTTFRSVAIDELRHCIEMVLVGVVGDG